VKDCYDEIYTQQKQDDYFDGLPYTRIVLESSVKLPKDTDIEKLTLRKYTYIFHYEPSEVKPTERIMFSASASRPLNFFHDRKDGRMAMIFNEFAPRSISMLMYPQIPSLKIESVTATTLPADVRWQQSDLGKFTRTKHAYVIGDSRVEEED
jgi:hypothetical protein